MVALGKDFKYKKIEKFLSVDEVKLCNRYADIKHHNNYKNFDYDQSDTVDTKYYADALGEALLHNKIKLMEKETGLSLLPSYSFWRMYTHGADLKKHLDRESCEISVTVMLGSDGTPWPIFMDGKAMDLNPGDAVIYLGTELEHWREPFKGDWHAQVFLHYVRKNGPHTDRLFDGKTYYGVTEIE